MRVDNYEHYIELYSHFGSKKTNPLVDYKTKVIQYANYLFDIVGVMPQESICNLCVLKFGNGKVASDQTIRSWLDLKFKVSHRVLNATKQAKTPKIKNESKKDVTIKRLENELDAALREIFTLQEINNELKRSD